MRLQKTWAVYGTDYEKEPFDPMRGLFACVTRESLDGGPKAVWQPEQRLSLADCIHAYTSGSAYAEFEDGKKGELRAGEYADFIVLSNDITKISPAEYLKTKSCARSSAANRISAQLSIDFGCFNLRSQMRASSLARSSGRILFRRSHPCSTSDVRLSQSERRVSGMATSSNGVVRRRLFI